MFPLARRLCGGRYALLCAARPTLSHAPAACGLTQSYRLQSTITNSSNENKAQNNDEALTDSQIDEWMQAIDSLDKEFSSQAFNPEVALAPEGQSKINLIEELTNSRNEFTPTPEQVKEWENLKNIPIPSKSDPILEHVTNMIMRHGKKERARKYLSRALYLVFCQTRQDPVLVLKKALDDLAPLMVVRTFKTGVAKAATVPVPLNQRQRHRIAWKWILEGSEKRVSSDFAVRLGEELLSVHKGNSSGFEKRNTMHKSAIANRAYIKLK